MLQLVREMRAVLDDIEQQIDALAKDATMQRINVFYMKRASGEYVLAPLLVAKAQLLVAIAQLMKDSK